MFTARVVRANLDLADPWRTPPGAEMLKLVASGDGSKPRLQTLLTLFHDGSFLYFVFDADDDFLQATMFDHDDPLYEEDVFEVFLSPHRLERYFELEVSPRGTTFDALVASPDRNRQTMHVDRSWTCVGMWNAVQREEISSTRWRLRVLLAIPFSALDDVAPPHAGTEWRANIYRIDRHPDGDFFAAWSPTNRTPPDFHVPDAFGTLRFE